MAARDIVLVLMDCATSSWLFGLPFFFFHGVEGISKKKTLGFTGRGNITTVGWLGFLVPADTSFLGGGGGMA